jgi:hypothetical protein
MAQQLFYLQDEANTEYWLDIKNPSTVLYCTFGTLYDDTSHYFESCKSFKLAPSGKSVLQNQIDVNLSFFKCFEVF